MQILVLNASALHLGFLGCYGNAWIATPNLDSLAAEGVVFDQHYVENVAAPFSVESIKTIRGSECVHIAASHGDTWWKPCVKAVQRLSKRASGLCWVDLPSLYPPWNVPAELCETYLRRASTDDEDAEDVEPFEPLLKPEIGPLDTHDLVLWERLRGTYAGAVTKLDAELGELIEALRSSNLFDQTLIVVTATRGLALGEHGIVGDFRPWLHDEVVHLPLIARQPGGVDGGRRVFGLTQPADLITMLAQGDSTWLREVSQGGSQRERCISRWALGEAEEWSLRTREYVLVLPIRQPADLPPRPVQFYLKPEDRWEANNIIQHNLDLAEELEKVLRG